MEPQKTRKELQILGENAVAEYITQRGGQVIRRNIKVGYDEIDILVLYQKFLVNVEVRTTSQKPRELKVSSLKRAKNVSALARYMLKNKKDTEGLIPIIRIYRVIADSKNTQIIKIE